MTHDEFNTIFEARVNECRTMLGVKANEYATGDRLHNFKVAAELQSCTPAQALGGMLAKHIVSIFDMLAEEDSHFVPEVWSEKLGDALNYLFLLDAVLIDANRPPF
jgi:hypothetical protein